MPRRRTMDLRAPCNAAAGSQEKLRILAERARRGLELFVEGDSGAISWRPAGVQRFMDRRLCSDPVPAQLRDLANQRRRERQRRKREREARQQGAGG